MTEKLLTRLVAELDKTNPVPDNAPMTTRNRRSKRATASTVVSLPLPPAGHPIWALGQAEVAKAHILCCLFAAMKELS